LGTEPPEYPLESTITTEQKARRVNNLAPSGQSAKPPPPVQIRAAPPNSLAIEIAVVRSVARYRVAVAKRNSYPTRRVSATTRWRRLLTRTYPDQPADLHQATRRLTRASCRPTASDGQTHLSELRSALLGVCPRAAWCWSTTDWVRVAGPLGGPRWPTPVRRRGTQTWSASDLWESASHWDQVVE